MASFNPPAYKKEAFVDREAELNKIRALLEQVRKSPATSGRVIALTGQRGMGKTWLLHHIQETFDKDKYLMILLDFADLARGAKNDDTFTRRVMKAFADAINAEAGHVKDIDSVPLARWSEWLIIDVRSKIATQTCIVVLLDNVYETDETWLDAVEQYLLAPLCVEDGVIIIMAGRGPFPLWRTRELAMATLYDLKPFDYDTMQKITQERQLKQEDIEAVGGYPLALGVLTDPQRSSEIKETLASVLSYILEPYYEALGAKLAEWPAEFLKKWMVLAVLRVFDQDRLKEITKEQEEEIRHLIDTLLRTNLASYKKDKRGYVLDEGLHQLWGKWSQSFPEQWQTLHQRAFNLYERWAKVFPQTASVWQSEADYHRGFLSPQEHHS